MNIRIMLPTEGQAREKIQRVRPGFFLHSGLADPEPSIALSQPARRELPPRRFTHFSPLSRPRRVLLCMLLSNQRSHLLP